jgi:hypothetical protein
MKVVRLTSHRYESTPETVIVEPTGVPCAGGLGIGVDVAFVNVAALDVHPAGAAGAVAIPPSSPPAAGADGSALSMCAGSSPPSVRLSEWYSRIKRSRVFLT